MTRRNFLPLALGIAVVLIGAVTRAWLWWQFGLPAGIEPGAMPLIALGGLLNDAVVALYLLAPLVLYCALLPDSAYRSRPSRLLLAIGSWLFLFALVFLAVAEFYFFQEFDARFNLVAFDYLAYPTEVAGDIWAEYPVTMIVLGAAALATAGVRWIRRRPLNGALTATRVRSRFAVLAAYTVALGLVIAYWPTDRLSLYSNRIANELVQNGLSSFMRAATTNEIDYYSNYASADSRENLALVERELAAGGGEFTRLADRRLDRSFPGRPDGLGRLNVVLVSSESFGAEFSRLYGSERNMTPNFDAFARESLWFPHTYASGTRTVRGLEAFVSSIPPIPTVSILRRPGNENVATWGAVMRSLGYRTSFLYGGFGYFDNMNYFFGNNGFETVDRKSIESPRFENMWGVSDEDLFDHSLEYLDRVHAAGKPFFSIIMTTSNHKPFTFPAGLENYGIPAEGGGRAAGVRYADFALGRFLRDARSHPWFDDTIFVVAADHGARVYGVEQIPLKTYEIPLMIYSPKHIEPWREESLMTQIDIAPTVLGMLGLPYSAPFFGQDALNTPPDQRVAFFNHNHDVAIYRDGRMVVFGLKKSVHTFDYDASTNTYAASPRDPELERLGIAYYQTAYELFDQHRYLPSGAPASLAHVSPKP